MPETQPKVGHLKGTSTNDTDRGPRDVPEGQPKVGHPHGSSANEGRPGGSAPNPLTTRGYGQAAEDEQPKNVRRANDHVGPAKGGEY